MSASDGTRPGTFSAQPSDVAAVLDAVDEPGYVFGHSPGGPVALLASQNAAERVRTLALYEPRSLDQVRDHDGCWIDVVSR